MGRRGGGGSEQPIVQRAQAGSHWGAGEKNISTFLEKMSQVRPIVTWCGFLNCIEFLSRFSTAAMYLLL